MRLRAPGLLGGLDGLSFAAHALGHSTTVDTDPYRVLDLSSGLTGRGAVLLDRTQEETGVERLTAVLTELGPRVGELPRESAGMAHGPAGPLALLSLAWSAGIEVLGQVTAIHRAVERILELRRDDAWGPDWRVPASWCHGSPGIARALWLAGTALDDARLRELAGETVLAALRRPPALRRIDGRVGLCHGLAGLLLITLRFAQDTADPAFRPAAHDVAGRLLDRYSASEPTTPGLLDGAAGVLLAVLSATTPVPPAWDRALLLS
ncbi:lanthionine synthetase C family protein [Streptomyces alanosinicus]|uniref:Lanthionine synthetase n=1 Tax=Streptomyces alanosinicus TaxID=68171 RepID=A0A919D7W8_9ACTN|nr:lanthionine synthetase C family protein [Streptomyces alanosinicus]GHE15468.1 hypothetical protein GCM10010339_90290 [Streptomyces alanosinicus]